MIIDRLLTEADIAALVYIADRHGLKRVPGLSRKQLVGRLKRHVPARALFDGLVAAKYGSYTTADLLELLLHDPAYDRLSAGKPRLDHIDRQRAVLLEGTPRRWAYTMRGHDVIIDLGRQALACDCRYYTFAARHRLICKHIATALDLIPEVYSRSALIDLLLNRDVWTFKAVSARPVL
ncbi:MAG: hypothetical protein GYB64_05970 [Chloroflexi bacterium]|nr:hypothetical protein [Chloroflexota bacterium]